jgi:predicted transcriptional regulator
MYNFNAHTLNGVAVSYSSLPNFALEFVERDTRLTLASKMIYIRLLRYAAMLKDTAFKITGSWLIEQLAMNRSTVTRSLAQLKQCGYVTDKGIVIPETEKAKTIENEQVQARDEVSNMVNDLLKKVGSSKAKTTENPVQNAPQDDAKSTTFENEVMQKAPLECSKSTTDLLKKHNRLAQKAQPTCSKSTTDLLKKHNRLAQKASSH